LSKQSYKGDLNAVYITLTYFHIHYLFLSANYHFCNRKKGEFSKRPYLQSIIVYILFFTNWILYLSTFYALLPEKVSEFIFLPIWFSLCILGFITFWREWRNSRVFSICIGFLSFMSFIFGLFLLVLSGM